MKLIVTSLVAIIFVAAGSFAAVVLKTPSEASASQAEAGDEEHHEDDHGEEKANKGKKADKHDDGHGKKASSGNSVRILVIPLMISLFSMSKFKRDLS